MFGSTAAHCATIAGPHKTDMMIEERLIFFVFPKSKEKVKQEMIPEI